MFFFLFHPKWNMDTFREVTFSGKIKLRMNSFISVSIQCQKWVLNECDHTPSGAALGGPNTGRTRAWTLLGRTGEIVAKLGTILPLACTHFLFGMFTSTGHFTLGLQSCLHPLGPRELFATPMTGLCWLVNNCVCEGLIPNSLQSTWRLGPTRVHNKIKSWPTASAQ